MPEITQSEAKIARTLNLRQGDPKAAMSLFSCYCSGLEGYEENKELAIKYLHIAAELCHPDALKFLIELYTGKKILGLELAPDVNKKVKYLKMLAFVDQVIDFNSINGGKDAQKYYEYELEAYAELGRIYVMDESFNSRELGYAISLKLAEDNNITESLFTLGYYWYWLEEKNMEHYYYERSLSYFERALNNDNSFWAKKALQAYNEVARFANEYCRGPEFQIPYYEE